MDRPLASPAPFFVSSCFHTFGLPELVLTNMPASPLTALTFVELLTTMVGVLITDPTNGAREVTRALNSTRWRPMIFPHCHIQLGNGVEVNQIVRTAVRKMEDLEEKVMLVEIYEELKLNNRLPDDSLALIVKHGLSLMEFADHENRIAGQDGYDYNHASKINLVSHLH